MRRTFHLVSLLGASTRIRMQALTASLLIVFATQAFAAKAASAPTPVECAAASTQVLLNACAYEDFLAANAVYAEQYRVLSMRLPTAQRDRLRRMQKAWIAFRTASCRYESGPTSGGSAQGYVYWACAARITSERGAALAEMATCREGDITCSAKKQ